MQVFALEIEAPPLGTLRDAMQAAGHPVSISIGIAGEASDEELDARDWETAFVRWTEPELHDVYLLERDLVSVDEEADRSIVQAVHLAYGYPESAGRLLVTDHLRRTRCIYDVQILPALLDDEDHPAWAALDVMLRSLAITVEGVIYADEEGFYDADGELLLPEVGDEPDDYEDDEEIET